MARDDSLAVVIVTYNRSHDLQVTLRQLVSLQEEFDQLIIVNNCSTDDTLHVIEQARVQLNTGFKLVNLDENLGGAGGFQAGLLAALETPADWIWMSDDDAIPQPGCLNTILSAACDSANAYGSTAICTDSPDGELCWPTPTLRPSGPIMKRQELATVEPVSMLTFLGLMVSREKAIEIGPPNGNYFISGDDMEYSIRLKYSGSKLYQVRDSVLVHPRIPRYIVNLFVRKLFCLQMPPWRRYYDVRNRIWNSRLSGGLPLALATVTSMLARLLLTLIQENERSGQIAAYFRGIRDGLLLFKENQFRQ